MSTDIQTNPIPPVEEAPVVQEVTNEVAQPIVEKKKFPFLLVFISFVLGGALVFMGTVLYSMFFTPEADNNQNNQTSNNQNNTVNTEKYSENKVFYTDYEPDRGIFYYDLKGKVSKRIRPLDIDTVVFGLGVYKDNFLAYGIREGNSKTEESASYIMSYDLKNNIETELKKFNSNEILRNSAVYSNEKYAYFLLTNKAGKFEKIELVVVDEKGTHVVSKSTKLAQDGRGGSSYDDNSIKFNDDGSYMTHVATYSERNGLDNSIYLYNLTDYSETILKDSVMARWISRTKFVYVAPNVKGLFVYDVETNKSEKLSGIDEFVFMPKVIADGSKILLEVEVPENDYQYGSVYLYDLVTKEFVKLIDMAIAPAWITDEVILVDRIRKCTPQDECVMDDYLYLNTALYNINTKEFEDFGVSPSVGSVTSLFSR